MKTFVSILLGMCLSTPLFAQAEPAAPALPPEELTKLVAPIALYPDSLIALILPSSTTSSDVVLAARYLAGDGDPAAIDNQPWSDSVKSLAHFPVVVKWMDENLAWTQQLGEVFAVEPADVMAAIQQLRAQARSSGLLTDTPQQKIIVQDDDICVVPAQPDVIYVPYYDPEVLWMHRSYYGEFMSFGIGFGVGNWLYYDCDWRGRSVWVQHRNPGWVYRPGWRRPAPGAQGFVGTPWHPAPRRDYPGRPTHQLVPVAVHPRGIDVEHQDFRGRAEHSTPPQSNGRPDRFVGVPVPAQDAHARQVIAPPPPAARPHQMIGVAPQPQREPLREGDRRPSPQQPHPPSHAPSVAATLPPRAPAPAPALAPAPAARPRDDNHVGSGAVSSPRAPAPSPSPAPAPAATPAAQSSGDDKQWRHR